MARRHGVSINRDKVSEILSDKLIIALDANLSALEKVKPKDLTAADIHVEIGASGYRQQTLKNLFAKHLT